MGWQKFILNIVLKTEMFFVRFFSIKQNRITFISLENNYLESDMKLIYDQIKDSYDIKLCLMHYKQGLYYQFLYFLNCIKQLYLVNTSKIVILHDNNYVVSNFKRKETYVIQLWHACGAIKKFGNVIDRTFPISNYNMILSTSDYWKPIYSQAFSVDENSVMPLGLPRTDELFDKNWCEKEREKLLKKYPILKNKKVILYAPTFRGNIYIGFNQIDIDPVKIVNQLDDNYIFIYKFHPLVGNYKLKDNPKVLNMNSEDTHKLFTISDMLISDYSSIIFDYMIINKGIILYTPDYKEYKENLGVFVDIEQLGLPLCNNESEIVKAVKNIDTYISQVNNLKNQFFKFQDGKSTERMTKYIEKIMKNTQMLS